MTTSVSLATGQNGRVRKQYNFWPGPIGLDAWDVDRLIALSADLPVRSVDIATLGEIDANYWSLDEHSSVRDVSEHLSLVLAADVAFPIILSASGRIMDGMHRVVKVLVAGGRTVRAVQFAEDPPPDYRNCRPEDLPYDE